MATQEELNTQLQQIDTAIARIISGEAVTEFEVGSGISKRRYKYQEITVENLQKERRRVLSDLTELSGSEPTFRKSSRMQLTHRKV